MADPCKQIVPFSFGIVIALSEVKVAGLRVAKKEDVLSPILTSPVFCTLNLVVPDEEAESISPLFVWLTMSEAFPPIPPDIDSGAGVVALPMNTEESKSELRIRFPVPLGASVRLSSLIVPIVDADPAPRLNDVALTPRVADEVMVVRPEAVIVVSFAASVRVFDPESRVRAPVAVNVVEAPSNAMFVSSIDTLAELISNVEPLSTWNVVPVAIDRVPEVNASDVSERRN